MLVSPRLIGFDFDGVIIDSISCMEMSWNLTAKEFALDISFEAYARNIGLPFEVILSRLGVPSSLSQKVKHRYLLLSKEFSTLVKPFPEALDFLLRASFSESVKTCVITSKPRLRAQELMASLGLGHVFLVCPEDVGRGKPFPDPLIFANDFFSIRSDASLYVGDMNSDYLAALAAGWHFAFAAWGYGEISHDPTHQPITYLPSPASLDMIIKI